MHAAVRNVLVVITFVGVFGTLLLKPFLPNSIQAEVRDIVCMIGVLGFGAILLYNRLALGVFFPGPPKDSARDK
jgi:hypothetical protein